MLVHVASLGYWLPNEPLPPGAEEAALAAQAERKKESRGRGRRLGQPKTTRRGARPLLTPAQVAIAEQWLASGKSVAEICAELGGISDVTLRNYIPGGRRTAREKYPELAAQADLRPKTPRPQYRMRKASEKKRGRPSTFVGERSENAEAMFLKGATMREIAEASGVNLTTVYRHFGLDKREYWEKRREEAQREKKNGPPDRKGRPMDRALLTTRTCCD